MLPTMYASAVSWASLYHDSVISKHSINWKAEADEADCPTNYDAVCTQMSHAVLGGEGVYNVYAGASDTSIYAQVCGVVDNHKFRAVHDYFHWQFHQDFTVMCEYELAQIHASNLLHFVRNSGGAELEARAAWLILLCDTAGQTWWYEHTDGGFVTDQARFVRSMIDQCGEDLWRDLTAGVWMYNFTDRFRAVLAKCRFTYEDEV